MPPARSAVISSNSKSKTNGHQLIHTRLVRRARLPDSDERPQAGRSHRRGPGSGTRQPAADGRGAAERSREHDSGRAYSPAPASGRTDAHSAAGSSRLPSKQRQISYPAPAISGLSSRALCPGWKANSATSGSSSPNDAVSSVDSAICATWLPNRASRAPRAIPSPSGCTWPGSRSWRRSKPWATRPSSPAFPRSAGLAASSRHSGGHPQHRERGARRLYVPAWSAPPPPVGQTAVDCRPDRLRDPHRGVQSRARSCPRPAAEGALSTQALPGLLRHPLDLSLMSVALVGLGSSQWRSPSRRAAPSRRSSPSTARSIGGS